MTGPSLSNRTTTWLLVGFIVLQAFLGVVWNAENMAPMAHPADPYHYLAKAIRFVDHLEAQGLEDLGQALRDLSVGGRPPGYQLLSVPFIALFGRSVDAALALNIGLCALLTLCVFFLGRISAGNVAGLLAAVVAAGYPPLVQLARIFRPHYALPFCAALSVLLLLHLGKTRSVRIAWLFGLSLAAGLLIHPSFAWVMCLPSIVFGTYLLLFERESRRPPSLRQTPRWLFERFKDRFVWLGLLPGALIAVVPAGAWYATQGERLLETARHFSGLGTVKTVGFEEVHAGFFWYARTSPGALSNVLAVMAAVGIVRCLVRRNVAQRLIAFTLVAGYCVVSLNWWLTWWYFTPLLPFAAAVTGIWVAEVRLRRLFWPLGLAAVAVACFNFTFVSWGSAAAGSLASRLGAPLDTDTCNDPRAFALCPVRPGAEEWPAAGVLEAVLTDNPELVSADARGTLFLNLDGVMKALFGYHLEENFPGSGIDIVYGSGPRVPCFRQLPELVASEYVFYMTVGNRPRDPARPFAHLHGFLSQPPRSFAEAHERLASFELPGGETGTLLRRTSPVSEGEMDEALAAMRRLHREVVSSKRKEPEER